MGCVGRPAYLNDTVKTFVHRFVKVLPVVGLCSCCRLQEEYLYSAEAHIINLYKIHIIIICILLNLYKRTNVIDAESEKAGTYLSRGKPQHHSSQYY